MADERPPKDRRYEWLYAEDNGSAAEQESSAHVDDETRVTEPRTDNAPEHTRILGNLPVPEDNQTSNVQRSFGGTYQSSQSSASSSAGPDSGARFLEPAAPQRSGAGGGGGTGVPGEPASRRPRRPKRRRRWWLRTVVTIIIVWLLFLFLVPFYAWSKVAKIDARPPRGRPGDTPGTTYLLVGSDSRAGLTEKQKSELGTGSAAGKRTDTLILVHVPASDGPTLWLSIPRDSYVEIPGHGENKINAAYSIGGADLLVHTVEANTGVRVDNYIEVGFLGLVKVVDAVGGITVCPKTDINDPKAGHLKMSAGCHHVDGHTALDYSRSRAFAKGDITREMHQRQVIAAIGNKAASWKSVVLPWRYWGLNMAAADSVRVGKSVSLIDVGRFAWAMANSGGPDTKRCVIPYSSLGTTTSAGSSVIWDEDKAQAIFKHIRADDTSDIQCSAQ